MQYDPKKVITTVDAFVVTGFAEKSMIEGKRLTDKMSASVGCQGDVVFVESANDVGEVTFHLKHTSPALIKFALLYRTRKEFAFGCMDGNFSGDVGIAGSKAVVKNLPDFSRGAEVSDVDVTIIVADYESAFTAQPAPE